MAYLCLRCGKVISDTRKKYCPKCKKIKREEWKRRGYLKRQEMYKNGPKVSAVLGRITEENSAYVEIWRKKLTMGQCSREEYDGVVKCSLPRINGDIFDEEAAVGLSVIMKNVRI